MSSISKVSMFLQPIFFAIFTATFLFMQLLRFLYNKYIKPLLTSADQQNQAQGELLFQGQELPNIRGLYDQRECAICLEEFFDHRNEVILKAGVFNCNHIFCYRDVSDLINRSTFRKIKCPSCRRDITLIVPSITNNLTDLEQQYVYNMRDYNFKHNEETTLWNILNDRDFCMRFLGMYFGSQGGIISFFKFVFYHSWRMWPLLCIMLYIQSPVDLIPEMTFGLIGYIDDLIALLLFMLMIFQTVRDFANHNFNMLN